MAGICHLTEVSQHDHFCHLDDVAGPLPHDVNVPETPAPADEGHARSMPQFIATSRVVTPLFTPSFPASQPG